MSAHNAAPDSNLRALSGSTPSVIRGFGSSDDGPEVTGRCFAEAPCFVRFFDTSLTLNYLIRFFADS